MALARCCLQRALKGFSLKNNNQIGYLATDFVKSHPQESLQKPICRHSSYQNSPFTEDLKGLTDYEVLKSPDQWIHVERLLAPNTVPKLILKDEYPSGFFPPSPESVDLPYFVERNKNHMIPVYLVLSHRGMKKISRVRRVKGDIWQLAAVLKQHLVSKTKYTIPYSVNELAGFVDFRGDYVLIIKEFLKDQGF